VEPAVARPASEQHARYELDPGVAVSLCVICGYSTLDEHTEVCGHHVASFDANWATGNRLMCDFLHRGIVAAPARRDALGS
jgi:hypothetical protein